MKRKRFTKEQIIKILRAREVGVPLAELALYNGSADTTIYTRKARYGGMEVAEAKRLKKPESENKKLKRLLAEAAAVPSVCPSQNKSHFPGPRRYRRQDYRGRDTPLSR